jgi:hypothetical protein
MKIDQKREALKGAYSGEKWIVKVDKMSDEQIIAVYNRLKSQGKV